MSNDQNDEPPKLRIGIEFLPRVCNDSRSEAGGAGELLGRAHLPAGGGRQAEGAARRQTEPDG